MTSRDRRGKGLTLVEGILLLALIGILGMVFIVVNTHPHMFGIHINRATPPIQRCAANLKELGTALDIYRERCGSYPSFGGRMDFAHLVACKQVGLDPLALLCREDPYGDNQHGNLLVEHPPFLPNSATPQEPRLTDAPFAISYDGRRVIDGVSIPLDPVNPSTVVIAAEREEFHKGTRLVLFLDRHVEQLSQWRGNDYDGSDPADPYDLTVLTDRWRDDVPGEGESR